MIDGKILTEKLTEVLMKKLTEISTEKINGSIDESINKSIEENGWSRPGLFDPRISRAGHRKGTSPR